MYIGDSRRRRRRDSWHITLSFRHDKADAFVQFFARTAFIALTIFLKLWNSIVMKNLTIFIFIVFFVLFRSYDIILFFIIN